MKKTADEILIWFYERGQQDLKIRAAAGVPLNQCGTSLQACKNYFEDLKRESKIDKEE